MVKMFLYEVILILVFLIKNIIVYDCLIDIIILKKLFVVRFVLFKFWNLLCYFRFDKSKWFWEYLGDRYVFIEFKGEGYSGGEFDVIFGV